ncbi:MAG: hypothetical protein ACMG57_00895, partial [Candidatus Dojkabacteria bacterium]
LILVIATISLGALSGVLFFNQQSLNTKIDGLNQQLADSKATQDTLQKLLDSKTSTSTTPSTTPTTVTPAVATKVYTSDVYGFKITLPDGMIEHDFAYGVSFTNDSLNVSFFTDYPNFCPVSGGGSAAVSGTYSPLSVGVQAQTTLLTPVSNGQVQTLIYTLNGVDNYFCGGFMPANYNSTAIKFIGVINPKFDPVVSANPLNFDTGIKPYLETYTNL